MVDLPEFQRWFDMAIDAQANAQVQQDAGSYHWACFMAEQSAQFAIKGLLHGIGRGAYGHDLVDLGNRLEHALAEPLTDEVTHALVRLSRHYIATRCPDAHPSGTQGPLQCR